MGKVVYEIRNIGLETIRKQTEERARLLYDFFYHDDRFILSDESANIRSNTTVCVGVKMGNQNLLKSLQNKGIVVGKGYGAQKNSHLRIGNFPAHTKEEVSKLLKALKSK